MVRGRLEKQLCGMRDEGFPGFWKSKGGKNWEGQIYRACPRREN